MLLDHLQACDCAEIRMVQCTAVRYTSVQYSTAVFIVKLRRPPIARLYMYLVPKKNMREEKI